MHGVVRDAPGRALDQPGNAQSLTADAHTLYMRTVKRCALAAGRDMSDRRSTYACDRSAVRSASARPSARQLAAIRTVVNWYFETHFRRPLDPGVTQMFSDSTRVGAFAADPQALAAGRGDALFRALIVAVMFQRRQDKQVTRILRGISAKDARELTSPRALTRLADNCGCRHARTTGGLRVDCDLTKHPETRLGICGANPTIACAPKRHTVLLKRYGHFGKVPTSAALLLREAGAQDLTSLLERAGATAQGKTAKSRALVGALSGAWRVSEKIASMFLSAVFNPDYASGAQRREDIDWRHFVVIDSNVDLFLQSIGYRGLWTYTARRDFLRQASRMTRLTAFRHDVQRDNPRIVQQAMYLFMSAANRRAISYDCAHSPGACVRCPMVLKRRCPVRQTRSIAPRRKRAQW